MKNSEQNSFSTDNKCENKENKKHPTTGQFLIGAFVYLVAGLASIYAVSGIAVASKHTKELLECRQRLANSSEASQEDIIRAEKLQKNMWVLLPKWALALIIAFVGLFTFVGTSFTLLIIFLRVRQKILFSPEKIKVPDNSLSKTPHSP